MGKFKRESGSVIIIMCGGWMSEYGIWVLGNGEKRIGVIRVIGGWIVIWGRRMRREMLRLKWVKM